MTILPKLLPVLSLAVLASCQSPQTPAALTEKAETAAIALAPAPAAPRQMASDTLPKGLQQLLAAYPDQLQSIEPNALIWKDGTKMLYDDGKTKDFLQLLNEADLEDQMKQPYPKGKDYLPLLRNDDPGRIRHEAFFLKMYGESPAAVRKKLRTIIWMPKTYKVALQVTTVNGIDKKLEAISAILDERKHLHPYLADPGGTFNWRVIAGTKRLSTHSFGSTIDINVKYSDYWRWNIQNPTEDDPRVILYKNKIPLEIVEIFEQHGFIWGGKWYHYDTMHFEYRPELLQ